MTPAERAEAESLYTQLYEALHKPNSEEANTEIMRVITKIQMFREKILGTDKRVKRNG